MLCRVEYFQLLKELEDLHEQCVNTSARASCITNLKEAIKEAENKSVVDADLEKYRNLTTKLEKEKVQQALF